VAELERQEQLRLQLSERAACVRKKMPKLFRASAGLSFGDVGGNATKARLSLRQKLIADGEAMGETEAGTERAFHIAHESVGGMFPGKMEPVQIAGFPEGSPRGDFLGGGEIIGTLREEFVGPVHEFGGRDLSADSGIDARELLAKSQLAVMV